MRGRRPDDREPGRSEDGGARGSAAPGRRTLTEQLRPVVQRKAATETAEEPEAPDKEKPPAAFAPSTGTKKTTIKGTYGSYEVEHGLVSLPDATKSPPWGYYKARITMKPDASTGGHEIGFIQTWRMKDVAGGGSRITSAKAGYVSADEAKRIDPKTGMAVDRWNPTGDKTPFFGMYKDASGTIKEHSTAHKGKHGGDDPWIEDKPGFNDPYEIEFTATATDMTDGTPFDAIGWGFKYDSANNVYTEETPSVVKAGTERIAARDRAYKKWNDDIATSGSGIDKIKMPIDPATTASTVKTALDATPVDAAKVRTALLAITGADGRARVAACYEVEAGRKLKDDLKSKMPSDKLTGLEDWTK